MHINSHYALGVIIASISTYYLDFIALEYTLIIIASFICDFDVFFSLYARDRNHRNLITHSIIPSVIIIIIGVIFNWLGLIIAGFAYLLHVVIDTFDWGTNLFYFPKKTIGLRFLISKDEEENLDKYLSKYKVKSSFFDFKYYNSKIFLFSEIFLFFVMLFIISLFTLEYYYVLFFYFPFLFFHLGRHYKLKNIEKS
ncbi:MAG: conserved membrane protein of unknown function [Promethearchaeota archaeon]|nr:MAG: conserved membrane protein of unknown function [Candidatus Lokiarchaeota archaeon]